MARTTRFREQHNELLQLAGQLQLLLDANDLKRDGAPARAILNNIMGKLLVHVSVEDKVLYPELQRHTDPVVSRLANKFSSEMKNTAAALVKYNEKWSLAIRISSDPMGFISETKQILSALKDRIKRENNELYAAADRVQGKDFV
jgi:hemerythrin-like domain-containing protein